MADFTIYIGNKNYSSWSLRGLADAEGDGVAFEEVLIPLYEPQSRPEILRHSPSGKVPALVPWRVSTVLGIAGDRRISGRAVAGGAGCGRRIRLPVPSRAPSATRCMRASCRCAGTCR